MSSTSRREPDKAPAAEKPRSVALAVASGVGLAGIVIGTLFVGAPALFTLAFVFVLVAQAELYTVLKASGHSPAVLLGVVCGGTLLIVTYVYGPVALVIMLAASLLLILAWGLTVPAARMRSMVVSTYLGVLYGPFLVGFAVLLLRGPDGLVLTATFIGMTALHDAGAYLVGRKLGRHPMAPRMSPQKSWEGFAAGTLVCVALSVAVLPFVHPFTVLLALKLALVMSVVAPLGDLAESLVKRDLGVKDMGSLMPGHGGLFDRIDAIIFAAPFAYFLLRVVGWAG